MDDLNKLRAPDISWIRSLMIVSLPLTFLVGRNYPLISLGGRQIYVGTTEILIPIVFIYSLFQIARNGWSWPEIRRLTWIVGLYSFLVIMLTLYLQLKRGVEASSANIVETVRWIMYLPVFFSVYIIVNSIAALRVAVFGLILGASVNVIAAIDQARSFNFAEARVYGAFVSGSIEQGDIMNANSVGLLFAMTAVFTLSVFQHSKRSEKLIAGLVGFACVACTFLTLSRAAMLGLVAGAILLGFYMKKRRAGYFGFLIMAAIVAIIVVSSEDFLRERLENTVYRVNGTVDSDSVAARLERWSDTLAEADKYMLVGAGLGNNTLVLGGVVADNQYLEVLACTGLIGLITFVAFNIIVLQYTQSERVNPDDYSQGVRVGIRGALICFYIANLSGAMFANPRLLGVFWFLAGLACAMRRPLWGSSPRRRALSELR